MACFIVPAAEAVVVTAISKSIERKQRKKGISTENTGCTTVSTFIRKRKWLTKLLWGGSVLLAFEHVWHGEVIPWFPFLTAAYSAEDSAAMLREMSTVGVCMAVVVTLFWVGMVLVSNAIERRSILSIEE